MNQEDNLLPETCKTVKVVGIKSDDNPSGVSTINVSDYDADVHVLAEDEVNPNGKGGPDMTLVPDEFKQMSNEQLRVLIVKNRRDIPARAQRGALLELAMLGVL